MLLASAGELKYSVAEAAHEIPHSEFQLPTSTGKLSVRKHKHRVIKSCSTEKERGLLKSMC